MFEHQIDFRVLVPAPVIGLRRMKDQPRRDVAVSSLVCPGMCETPVPIAQERPQSARQDTPPPCSSRERLFAKLTRFVALRLMMRATALGPSTVTTAAERHALSTIGPRPRGKRSIQKIVDVPQIHQCIDRCYGALGPSYLRDALSAAMLAARHPSETSAGGRIPTWSYRLVASAAAPAREAVVSA